MTDNVIISIKGTQVSAEGGPDEMELVTAGVLNQEGEGRYTISYEESELTGLEGTTTVVRVDGPRVTLLREGSINSQMVFEEGQRHLSMYETPYGSLSVGILTRRQLLLENIFHKVLLKRQSPWYLPKRQKNLLRP